LASLVHFAVIPRPGQAAADFPKPFRGTFLKGFPTDISSTRVRDEVKAGRDIGTLVPPGVAEIIRNNQLYFSG
jgi:nicotinic acid mononucleotide adenylyltransferase